MKTSFVFGVILGLTFAFAFRKNGKQVKRKEKVGVGVGALLLNKEGYFLLGLRKGSHGSGTWALPGGWLEIGEDFTECAVREIQEETGLNSLDLGIPVVLDVAPSNNIFPNIHSVSVFVTVPLVSDTPPKVTEPDKCEQWEWFPLGVKEAWPENLFPSARHLLYSRAFAEIL